MWFRNTWSWGYNSERPYIKSTGSASVHGYHRHLKDRYFYAHSSSAETELLFVENETNFERLFNSPNRTPYVKDGINEYVVSGRSDKVNPAREGTKMAAHFKSIVQPGESFVVDFRFSNQEVANPFDNFTEVLNLRKSEADEFYESIHHEASTAEEKMIQRQAFAGLLFSKQFYHYSVELWLSGDVGTPKPPQNRMTGRNSDWKHLYANDLMSMPDKWEYPWFAAWDLCFHCIPLAMVDPTFAKRQLILILREWYMHPNGQIPAYEWAFGDTNPPVHAYAAYKVYKIDSSITGVDDVAFLEKIFHKLLLNFTWWVNKKDEFGKNVFQGGFLGLDNIGVFDRSAPLPPGYILEQSDGTAWMGMYSLNMLRIALELAIHNPAYEDVATKFFEHFIYIADAVYSKSEGGISLWNDEDGFFYDLLRNPERNVHQALKIRSFVGLISVFAAASILRKTLESFPNFNRRIQWFIKYRPELIAHLPELIKTNEDGDMIFAMVSEEKLKRVMVKMLDEGEFLSEHGLRSLSRFHETNPFEYKSNIVNYEPAESQSGLFGGNSNWRGPIWFPVNYLMIDTLMIHHKIYKDTFKVELPTGSGKMADLRDISLDLSRRLLKVFLKDEKTQQRPVFGGEKLFQEDEHWRDYVLFYEYFHGNNGAGLGASHQTGWTALIARVIDEIHSM